MKTVNSKPVISVKELSKILNIGINNAYALVRSGQIRSVRIGRQYRIPYAALIAYLEGA